MTNKDKHQNDVQNESRRKFLKNSGLTVGSLVAGGTIAGMLGANPKTNHQDATDTETASKGYENPNEALMFFTPAQYQTTQAATERIFPKDEIGPGAKELNVAIYIDHQLASPWGINAKNYMSGPFFEPEPTQGAQLRILRKDMFRLGLQGLDDYSQKKYQKAFTELETEEQDQVLVDFEEGKAYQLAAGLSTSGFFTILKTLTIEGVYADPMYGGNKEMQGWKMRNYPGTRMSYAQEIKEEKFIKLDPQSLRSHMG
ncbi:MULTISPECIES: gluconate 2-dehydrogenase subunit 3 family protein [unclassified Sporosarcina]|uniref:gluconate 2-dehydrogenase subunit 3 family protein n=1 Tax=unclassified Sporosarcina TaxID=2647733 RepID=UPI002041215E|nr:MULTISPECIES: gluconate 2-dehydrogenase subunit 3 family protein [unclassified Sporosarcina]GKV64468.1 oxidoreductase [Sporosarcina sp. NCCP-2331]GLB55213.1 oxidoreductase [Sporosarcina sp. NCCP-2378]